MHLSLLLADTPPAAEPGANAAGMLIMFLPIIALVGFMFFMSRRQKKVMAAQSEFRNELAPGQEVMTGSGMFGTVVAVDNGNDRITIESGNTRTVWARAAIAKRIDAASTPAASTSTDASDAGTELADLDSAAREYQKLQGEDK